MSGCVSLAAGASHKRLLLHEGYKRTADSGQEATTAGEAAARVTVAAIQACAGAVSCGPPGPPWWGARHNCSLSRNVDGWSVQSRFKWFPQVPPTAPPGTDALHRLLPMAGTLAENQVDKARAHKPGLFGAANSTASVWVTPDHLPRQRFPAAQPCVRFGIKVGPGRDHAGAARRQGADHVHAVEADIILHFSLW